MFELTIIAITIAFATGQAWNAYQTRKLLEALARMTNKKRAR